ncbi:unnamed protein product [Rotaria sp. Silwood2]|nr:unnamed protein product [Rotaria sp. Silwood2]CAF3198494.1 unnamed protein product [Rotaria sp. Silwood2]CAF4294381.1 unnamed protein product [Rotaria sp. Silwood2]CAF4341031.1 unnamed protein product [Rotaria sp. Silwood2]CAF4434412.1 unnamed protein product [Rotaria sp. Silwood2]
MDEKVVRYKKNSNDIHVLPPSPYTEVPKPNVRREKLSVENEETIQTKKKLEKTKKNFLFDPRRKTFLGRSSLNWARLAAFYTVFYFCLGMFFVILLYVFALILDREVPTYYNKDSTMAVRTTATVVGMGFRPQPMVDDSLIRVSNDLYEQKRIASSLRLYRDVYLIQKTDAKAEPCTELDPASELVPGTACSFSWFDIVSTQDHPCSDNNMYGFKHEEPCVLVKLNKVYGWTPTKGPLPIHIQGLRNIHNNKSIAKPDVYITCEGTNPSDRDAQTEMVYYSLEKPSGSSKYGVIPNYYFPYRNARDHVQPFVLVQFKNLPLHRLISITCRAWSPGIEHETRGMRGMVAFQLYRSQVAEKLIKDDN